MTTIETFRVRRDDVGVTDTARDPAPALADGQALLAVERFGYTSNNITYATFGDAVGYWRFFPAPEPWGVVPVWGFARVVESRSAALVAGERLFGYLPPASHLVVEPGRATRRTVVDAAAHRAELPPTYNEYTRVAGEPDAEADGRYAVLRPLFITSWLLAEWIAGEGAFGAETILVLSASSRTAIGMAERLGGPLHHHHTAGRTVLGLTSARNRAFVDGLDVYDHVSSYDEIEALDTARPTLIVDMGGDPDVLARAHARLGASLLKSVRVGDTHQGGWRRVEMAGPKPEMFFAPDVIRERRTTLGPDVFGAAMTDAMTAMSDWTKGWLRLREHRGLAALAEVHARVRSGAADPAEADVVAP